VRFEKFEGGVVAISHDEESTKHNYKVDPSSPAARSGRHLKGLTSVRDIEEIETTERFMVK
jgi:hypothetical protein